MQASSSDKYLNRKDAMVVLDTLLDELVQVKNRIDYLGPRRQNMQKIPSFKRAADWYLVYAGLGGALTIERQQLEKLEFKLGEHVKKYFSESIPPL